MLFNNLNYYSWKILIIKMIIIKDILFFIIVKFLKMGKIKEILT